MISNLPARIHKKLEAIWTSWWNRKMEAVATNTPDDSRGVDVTIRNFVVHELPENHTIWPAQSFSYTKKFVLSKQSSDWVKIAGKQPPSINHFQMFHKNPLCLLCWRVVHSSALAMLYRNILTVVDGYCTGYGSVRMQEPIGGSFFFVSSVCGTPITIDIKVTHWKYHHSRHSKVRQERTIPTNSVT